MHLNKGGKFKLCTRFRNIIFSNRSPPAVSGSSETNQNSCRNYRVTQENETPVILCDDHFDLEYHYDNDIREAQTVVNESPYTFGSCNNTLVLNNVANNFDNTHPIVYESLDIPNIPKISNNCKSDFYKLAHLSYNFSNDAVFSSPISTTVHNANDLTTVCNTNNCDFSPLNNVIPHNGLDSHLVQDSLSKADHTPMQRSIIEPTIRTENCVKFSVLDHNSETS